MRKLVAIAWVLLNAQPACAAGWGLAQLMQNLAQVKTASAAFTERKTIKMLNAPLMEYGTLAYSAPDEMQKITLSPVPERFSLDGQQVSLTGGADHQSHIFSLSEDPRIGGLTTGILSTLAGDLPALTRAYDVQLLGSQTGWQLLLQPRDARVLQLIAWIRIDGTMNKIDAIDTQSSNGDHSEMSVDETITAAR